jgi:hypothetical protein
MAHDLPVELEARQERWRRFLDQRDVGAQPFLFLIRYAEGDPQRPPLWPEHRSARIEWAWSAYQAQLERTQWLADDAVPCLQVSTGTEIFAEAFGCPVHRPADNMPFALPLIRSAAQVDSLAVPELSTSSLAYLFEMADELHRRAPEALLRVVDLQTPMDIAALIWEKADLLAATILAPEAVRELAAKVSQVLTAFLDEWFRRYGTRYVSHCPDYPMDGGITFSEDEVGAVSAGMFAEFFRDELVAFGERYGGLGIHCCANSRHQWDHFKALPGLRLLNLNQPHERLAEAFAFFDTGVAQMHTGYQRQGPPESWPQQHPPGQRVVLEVPAGSRAEAMDLAARLEARRPAEPIDLDAPPEARRRAEPIDLAARPDAQRRTSS